MWADLADLVPVSRRSLWTCCGAGGTSLQRLRESAVSYREVRFRHARALGP